MSDAARPAWRRPAFWFAAAAAAALAALLWWWSRDALLAFWQGHYGNWRDRYLAERLWRAPGFFAALAGIAVAVALLLRPAERLDARRGEEQAGSTLLLWGLLAATLLVGLPTSLAEWQRFGLPCWDGYCERAALWADWFGAPTQEALVDLFRVTAAFYTGDSVLPPLLIGAVAALGLSVTAAFMVVNLLSWAAVAALTVRIGRRLGLTDAGVATALLFLFGHLAVARSLLFLQTDPIALAFVMLALDALLAHHREPTPHRAV
ncbi:MAG TPA: hypothetical protein VKU40_04065, partial [Thermoanaerobaculia bacterium]|nr:hypothetical protein [Thermoanaerobaculia bacterium]